MKRYNFNRIEIEEKEYHSGKKKKLFSVKHKCKFHKPIGSNTLSGIGTLQKNNTRKSCHDKL